MRIQPRIKQKRVQVSPRVLESIEAEVRKTARKFNVSRSWVIAVALGDQFGVDVLGYHEVKPKRKLRLVG